MSNVWEKYKKAAEPIELQQPVQLPQFSVEASIRVVMDEPNLNKRLEMLQMLLHQVSGASKPYINFLIRKTIGKINDANELPF
jgi:hypothetical protein